MDRTLKMLMLGLAIIVVYHAPATQTTNEHSREGENLSLVRRNIGCSWPFRRVGRKCYYFGRHLLTFAEAAAECYRLRSILATPRNNHENVQLFNAMGAALDIRPGGGKEWWEAGYWIGAYKVVHYGWAWTTGQPIAHTQWCAGEPNGPKHQFCVHVNAKDESPACWDDFECSGKRKFACQRHLSHVSHWGLMSKKAG